MSKAKKKTRQKQEEFPRLLSTAKAALFLTGSYGVKNSAMSTFYRLVDRYGIQPAMERVVTRRINGEDVSCLHRYWWKKDLISISGE